MKGILDYFMRETGTGPYAVEAVKRRERARTFRERVKTDPVRFPLSENVERFENFDPDQVIVPKTKKSKPSRSLKDYLK